MARKMPVMDRDDVAGRARQRDLARRGYDAISLAYCSDDSNAAPSSAEDVSRYAGWVVELAGLLRARLVQADLARASGGWLRPGGYFLAVAGTGQWAGTESYLGAGMSGTRPAPPHACTGCRRHNLCPSRKGTPAIART